MKYELIIFDWDGTLMDSSARIVNSLRNAARDVDLVVPTKELARNVIGLNLADCLVKLFGRIPEKLSQEFIDRYRYHFYHPDAHEMPFFDGVMEGLARLDKSGKMLAVATGKGRRGLAPLLHEHDLERLFVTTRCADESYGKPNPQMLYDILEFTGQATENTVMIGDTSYDLQMANNAGMESIAVNYGMHGKAKLIKYKPVKIFSDFPELIHWLLS